MVYRIDIQHFLSHAIDHFTRTELTSMQYAIISSKVKHSGRVDNVAKFNEFYPTPEIIIAYDESKDKTLLEKMYFDFLDPSEGKKTTYQEISHITAKIYEVFVNPLMMHYDIVILCDESENDYISAFCKFLKKRYSIEVIDLNELFTKGRVGPIYIDRDEIRDKAVDIRRAALNEQRKAIGSTREGKEKLIGMMTLKEKLKQLKRYGVKISKNEMHNIDRILLEAWCAEDGQDDDDV